MSKTRLHPQRPHLMSRGLETRTFDRPIAVNENYLGIVTVALSPHRMINEAWPQSLSLGLVILSALVITLFLIWLVLYRRPKDNSEQTHAAEQLHYLSNLLASVQDAVIGTDLNYVIRHWNAAAHALYGWTADEVLGQPMRDFVRNEYLPGTNLAEILQAITEVGYWQGEVRQNRRDGALIPILASVSLVNNAQGKPIGYVSVNRDISARIRSEEKLSESERKFSNAFHVGPAGLTITRIQDGKFIDANEAFLRMFEYSRDEVIGHTSTELNMWTPEERQRLIQKQVASGGLRNHELRAISKSGRLIDLLFSSQPMELDGESYHITTMIDITERKQVEQERQKFVMLANSSSEFIGMCDLDFQPTYVNPAGMRMVGLPDMAAACSVKVQDYFFPEDRPFITEEFFPRVLREGHGDVEIRLRHFQTGEPIWMYYYLFHVRNASGTVIGWATVSRDITERRRAEEKIAHLNERITLATRAARLGVWDWDIPNNQLVWDDQMIEFYGVRAEDFSGAYEAWASGLHPEDRDHAEEETRLALLGEREFDTEFRVVWPDGTVRHLKANAAVIRNADGRPVRMIGINYDITDRKRAEQALHESEERLRLSTELADVAVWEFDFTTNRMSRSENHDQLYGLEWQTTWKFETFLESTHPEDRADSNRIIQESAAPGGPDDYQFDFRVVHPDGSIHWLFVVGQIVQRDAQGQGTLARGSLIDITARKQAEHSLVESEQRYRALFENMPAGFVLFEAVQDTKGVPADLVILAANDEFAHATGLMVSDVIGKSLSEVLPGIEDDAADWIGTYGTIALTGTPRQFEQEIELLGDHFSVTAYQSGPKQCAVSFSNITERVRAEQALRESQAQLQASMSLLQATVDNVPALVYVFDLDECMLIANNALGQLLGKPPAELIGKRRHEFLPKEIAERDEANDRIVIAAGVPQQFEELGTFDGKPITFLTTKFPLRDESGAIWGVGGISTDISERKQAEEALRLQSAALNAAANAILITDETGIIEWVNHAFYDLTGYTAAEAIGKNPRELINSGQHDRAFFKDLWDTVLAGQVWRGEIINRRKDGSVYTEEEIITPLHDSRGAISHFIAIKQDISPRKALEAENQKLAEQFYQAQKMESIGQLAGGIAHDFNNLLVPIVGYAELGMLTTAPDSKLYGQLEQIKRAGERAAGLTRQILAFSRRQVLEMQTVYLNKVITEFGTMLQRLIGENITLTTLLAHDLPAIRADTGQIEQVLLNLVVNARDAMPNGGHLSIETAAVTLDESYVESHMAALPGAYVQLTVSDTGHGMDAATQARIFEPFFTTKARGHGTGLGLATVFGIVKQHGGNIWVYSEPERGTSFKIYLPVAEPMTPPADKALPDVRMEDRNQTILVVEDELAVRQLVCNTLQAHGYQVLEASNPAAALELAAAYGSDIQLLITDVILPAMNGHALFQRLVEQRRSLKVLYMSGYTDSLIEHHGGLEAGAAFLAKPFGMQSLLHKVRAVLR